ncbi:hypothetical protein LTR56_014827 [Elasticomyces elasticus]|nr:hypothetical protein LTR56_014827 [Elasticomyces elasticus]KAK3644714.1 hypothetical protein LTR22_015089 [Elasticomyces elasticus]KAK4916099.1 hypothetical protein LTR49_015873 [Elasticomyces elasticus]KAK5755162.1 hypothetical protein LTS12_014726 [Elasticomyces elasticus]
MESETETASLLYSALPILLQRRLPKMPSFRRTAGKYSKPTAVNRSQDPDSEDECTTTPPPSYHTTARNSMIEADEEDDEDAEAFHSLPPSRPSSSGAATPSKAHFGDSGVQWKYAKQGFSLLAMSAQEESLLEQDSTFTRKLYVDSLGYLLRGLPQELVENELASLQMALPEGLKRRHSDEKLCLASRSSDEDSARHREQAERSTLHRTVATMTLYLFLALSVILPYVQLLLQQAYQYDRRYKISDRVLAQSYITADALGKQAMIFAAHVGAMNDGQIGVAVKDAGLWWLRGVSGGLYDGVGEGMQALGCKIKESKSLDER